MKKLLLATMLGAAFAANAASFTGDFSYAEGQIGFYGIGQSAQTYDVAIFLPGEEFAGCKIKAINVPLYTPYGISYFTQPSVWLSSSLKLDKGTNSPDIASYEADITAGSPQGNIGLTLPEEYTVTDAGVYVGYSFTTTAYNDATAYPLALSQGTNRNSCFVHASQAIPTWENVNASDGLSSALTVSIEKDNLSANNVSFVSVPDFVTTSFNESANVPVVLSTSASEPVASVDFEFTFAGNTGSYHYELPTPVPATFSKSFEANVLLPAYGERITEDVVLKLVKVNGNPNESDSNSATVKVIVVPEAPKHQTLIEEYTGTWCPWCTRGFAALEYMAHNYPEFVTAAYHNGDPMQVTTNYPANVTGFPSASLNRVDVGDPYWGLGSQSNDPNIVNDVMARNAQSTPWSIGISHIWDDDDHLTANVDVSHIVGFSGETYKIGYLLISDGLTGTASSWSQKNNYASYAPEYIPELNDFCRGGKYGKSSVKGLVFNDVVISVSGYKGVTNSIPKSLEAEEVVSHSQTWDLSKIKSELIPDKNKLRIVAFVLDSKGKVLNCAKQDITDFVPLGVEAVGEENADAPVEYYNLNGVKVDNPSNGIFIRRQGSKTTKVVVK